ncbi:hypothetical protein E2562_008745 [Oryza meyeriana var. granulata]|uniref:Disease resistance R13L4/SHOC-2-like LRR domain-containing protein n=1 Tax=Oryza meyeriana var. granulata TaxID=110450 RepID=A0A6G1F5X6_9ORYZ|nr:hypothetical protein E2562_008745 [Oryza meyeriana var. granulata]
MDAPSGQPTPPPPPPQTETANAAGGGATPPVPPPPQTGTPGLAAAQPQPQQPTEAKGDELPPPPATGVEEVTGQPQPPTAPASKLPAPPEPRAAEAKGEETPPPVTGAGEVASQPQPPRAPASKPHAPPDPRAEEVEGQPQPPSAPASEPPAPPAEATPQRQQQAGDAAKEAASTHDEADGGKKKSASSLWHLVREWVRKLRHRKRSPPPPSEQTDAPLPHAGEVTSDVLSKARKEEEGKGEGSKSGRDEAKAPAPTEQKAEKIKSCLSGAGAEEGDGTPASTLAVEPPQSPDKGAPPERHPLLKRFQKVIRAIHFVTWLSRKIKGKTGAQAKDRERKEDQTPAPGKVKDQPPAPGKEEEKPPLPAAAGTEEGEKNKKAHRRWTKREEVRLQKILEDAFEKLLSGEFDELKEQWRQCLLKFSVFPVDHHVKKQAVTYWWAAEFRLEHSQAEPKLLDAEEIFDMLCDSGFLEPIKNRCSGASHGCRVNPMVHWMVKKKARNCVADLDERGDPADVQRKSPVLCLTAGNRERLQMLGRSDNESPSQGPQQKEPSPARTPSKQISARAKEQQNDKTKLELQEFDNKRVILNINAHVYRLPDCLLSHLSDQLIVLQLGRWLNFDDNTYMEAVRLEKMSAIGNLKNLQYLGIRGLSKLTELPKEVKKLQKLKVLDVRGCQNLTSVMSSTVKSLRQLTHLDLTECYMLEHIGREITSLSGLQVFKGFVFGVDAGYRNKACRLQDLVGSMKKLRKLSINVTTDANVDKNEMAQLRHLDSLQSLTITWGELPSILTSTERTDEKEELLERWTGLVFPPNLVKLDVRCYPTEEIPLKWFEPKGYSKPQNLTKLYVRGGAVERLYLPEENNIVTLRLRYLKEFKMQWGKMFNMMKKLRYVEVVYKDAKVMKSENTKYKADKTEPHMVKQEKKKAKEEEEKRMAEIKQIMKIPKSTLDEHGVWEWDQKETHK